MCVCVCVCVYAKCWQILEELCARITVRHADIAQPMNGFDVVAVLQRSTLNSE